MTASISIPVKPTMTKTTASLQAWLVCLSASLFFFYEFIQMGMFNSISSELMRDFNISAVQLGYLSATYFYADVAFLFFAGMLLDRFSTRTIILTAMLVCVTSTITFALSANIWFAGLSHFAAGMGNAFCFLSCIKLASRWFPPQRMALITGITVTIAFIGGTVSQTPLTLLVQAFGWRHAVLLDAALGTLIIGIVWYFVQDKPVEQHEIQTSTPTNIKGSVKFALKNWQNWLGGIYTCFLNLPIFLLAELWGVMYLVQVHHIPQTSASMITSMVFIGSIFGCPLVGWLSDYIGKRRAPMIGGAIGSLAIILMIMFMPHLSFNMLLALFFALGFFTSAQVISYPAITESNPKAYTGTAVGLASVLIMGGGAVFQPLFGWLMDLNGDGKLINNTAVYSAHDYLLGMAIMPIAFIIGLIAALLLKETHCRPYHLD
jgi:MFS family permease